MKNAVELNENAPGIAFRGCLLEYMQLHVVHVVRIVANESREREFPDFCQLFESEGRRPSGIFEPVDKRVLLHKLIHENDCTPENDEYFYSFALSVLVSPYQKGFMTLSVRLVLNSNRNRIGEKNVGMGATRR